MNITAIKESLENIRRCLNKIEDETEVRPGEQTIRGTDAGVIDAAEIMRGVEAAREDVRAIEREIANLTRSAAELVGSMNSQGPLVNSPVPSRKISDGKLGISGNLIIGGDKP